MKAMAVQTVGVKVTEQVLRKVTHSMGLHTPDWQNFSQRKHALRLHKKYRALSRKNLVAISASAPDCYRFEALTRYHELAIQFQ